jgi:DNA repair protein RadC
MAKRKIADLEQPWRHPGGKLLRAGPQTLTAAELLAVIISAGTAKHPAERIAAEIVEKYSSFRGIAEQPFEALRNISGLGQVKLCRIAAALEIGRRMAEEERVLRNTGDHSDG